MGELLLPYRQRQFLTWDELDCLFAGQDVRRQKDLAAFRLIAVQIHNALAESPLKPSQYLFLPAVDGVSSGKKPNADWLQRMKNKYGDRLETAANGNPS